MDHDIFPVFLSGYPCHNRCAYCNTAGSTGITDPINWSILGSDLEKWIERTDKRKQREIAVYGNDLLSVPDAVSSRLIEIFRKLKLQGDLDSVRTSLRPDSILVMDESLLRVFSTIEIGIPVLDDNVLNLMQRDHNTKQFIDAVAKLKALGIQIGFQTMIGLPESTWEIDVSTAQQMAELKPNLVRIHPTLVLKNTKLQKMYELGDYKPLELEEAVKLSSVICEIYSSNSIVVARCGFHLPETVRKNILIAGPWHPAFGQLVKSRIWRDRLSNILEDDPELAVISVPESELSNAIGQKAANVKWLSEKYGREIRIKSAR